MGIRRVNVFADYYQFYLWDAGTSPGAPEDYSDEDVRNMVKVAPHVVAIQTVRNTHVPVEVEEGDTDPGFVPEAWDHVVECALHVPTGHAQVHECTGGPVLDLDWAPQNYRIRVLFSGLDEQSGDASIGGERCRIQAWPGGDETLRVIKQWPAQTTG